MRLVLHIGAPKSGTSSIQGYLSANARAYNAEGILYPRSGRIIGHKKFPRHLGFRFAMRGADQGPNFMMPRFRSVDPEVIKRYANEFVKEFDHEIECNTPQTVVMSDEGLIHDGVKEAIGNISSFLRERFDEIVICCSLRNPYDYIRGRVSSAIPDHSTFSKNRHGRFRGPKGARDEFLLAATAQNFRKLAKLVPGVPAPA